MNGNALAQLLTELGLTGAERICGGWSADEKYCVTRQDGSKALLRLSDAAQGERKRAEFAVMQAVEKLGVPMCRPVRFGMTEDCAYVVQTWIDGQDAEKAVPRLSDTEQYMHGLHAGRILRKIHTVPAPETQPDWSERFNSKLDRKIDTYRTSPIGFDGAEAMIAYVQANRHLLDGRPQTLQHGDYHIGNMMLEDGALVVIDFDRFDYGDPWEEFNRITWSADASPFFATGLVNGYFDGNVPEGFWRLLALYVSGNTLGSVGWAIPFGQEEVNVQLRMAQEVLGWYEGMTRVVPSWYLGVPYVQETDGVPYRLKQPFDFDFLYVYGQVFRVYDDQDSGNICFGLKKDGKRYFLKFAGAPTVRYDGRPETAVERLKPTAQLYRTLAHENLIRLVEAGEMGGGYGVLFEWTDAVSMGRMYPAQRERFMAMPIENKLQVFEDVLQFHIHAAELGYAAVDFYDGTVMYDFEEHRTLLCDIDFYQKAPFVNEMGRMWGSSRFMSPEEFTRGAVIDEITNVYVMGALAFALFAEYSREEADWQLGKASFLVARRAVQNDRSARYPTICALLEDWREAVRSEAVYSPGK